MSWQTTGVRPAPPGVTASRSGELSRTRGVIADEQIARFAYQVGLRGEALLMAVAIALAESGGDSGIFGDTTITTAKWGPSIGLWQIRSLKAERGTGGTRDASRLTDPTANAASMYAISNGGKNWRPWSVYTNGRYRQFLGRARAAVAALSEDIDSGALELAGLQTGSPGDNVVAVYRQLLGRDPTPEEKARYESYEQVSATPEAQGYRAGTALMDTRERMSQGAL